MLDSGKEQKGQKKGYCPDQFSEIERSGCHEQVYGVPNGSLEIISIHAMIMFDMTDDRFNACSASKFHPGFSSLVGGVRFFRSGRNEYPGIIDSAFSPCILGHRWQFRDEPL